MTPLRLIVGLGNPGDGYQSTRHNAGAWFVERAARMAGVSLAMQAKFQAITGSVRSEDGADRRLALPQTFMNRSGFAVSALARFYRIAPEEILVAHDELDLRPGTVKLKYGGGNAGHNGLRDVTASLGTPNFWRLRIGIGHPREGELSEQEVADYVLHRPRAEEELAIDGALTRAIAIWPFLAAGDTERAMHELHTLPKPPATTATAASKQADAAKNGTGLPDRRSATSADDDTEHSNDKGSKTQ